MNNLLKKMTVHLSTFFEQSEHYLQLGMEQLDQWFSGNGHRVESKMGNPKELLKTKHTGICMDGKRAISQHQSFEGVAVFGGTGSGKSTVVQINTLLRPETDNISIFCHDPSKEIALKTAKTMQDKGYTIKYIDLSNYRRSSGINVFPENAETSLLAKLASTAFRSEFEDGKRDFWRLEGESILTDFCELAAGLPKEYRHLPQITAFIDEFGANPKRFDKFVARYARSERLVQSYLTFIAKPPKLLQSVLAMMKASLKTIAKDENIAKILSHQDIEWSDLRKNKTIVYLQNSVASMKYYAPISNLIFTSFFQSIFAELPKKTDLPIYLLCDESSSLHFGHDFANYCANVRKYNVNITTFWQHPKQIESIYGKDYQSILNNQRTKLWITAGMQQDVTTDLQNAMGQYEFQEEDSKAWKKRHLRTATELAQTESKYGLLQYGHYKPMQVRLHRYYELSKMRQLAEQKPPIIKGTIPHGEVPLFDFNQL